MDEVEAMVGVDVGDEGEQALPESRYLPCGEVIRQRDESARQKGKGTKVHGKGFAVLRRTAKTTRRRQVRQYSLCCASRERSTAMLLPCNPSFAVRLCFVAPCGFAVRFNFVVRQASLSCAMQLPCGVALPCVRY
jgi:hypothetical protein